MAKTEEFLAAGACVPVKDKLPNEAIADMISARVYRHPSLGDRPVVRLIADNLAAGEDLTLEFLGFAKPEVIGPIAKRRRQALGFPGWALINDPSHSRYALELVKEFKKAVRKSKSKPGHGYDEFVEISKRLGKSVAHFLPSFWEQVGREFLALDNATYASRAFGKAREAEKVHALKVDESTRQDAFLEFALGGAVSIKALVEYGKELQSTHDPKAAWKFFREICIRRTLGGMPPWTSMIKDLQPLMKVAGLDPEQEIQSIIAEIIDSPAISRAAMGFWDSASKSIAALVKHNHRVAGMLLNMIPQTSSWDRDDLWPWLKHLKTWGILEHGWKDNVPEAAQPTGGPAAWLVRLLRACDRPRQPIFDIVTAMAPRLRSEKSPVDLYKKERWGDDILADVDLLDLALELKIPVADPPAELALNLSEWSELEEDDKSNGDRPRNPTSLVADLRFQKAVRKAVQDVVGDSDFEKAAAGKSAFEAARREWLNSLVESVSTGGLPRVDSALDLIENKTSHAIFREFPEALETLKAVDVPSALARTIQAGLIDEFGWPALEKVYESFPAGKTRPMLFGQFPNLIVTDGLKVLVLRGDKVIHEAELKLNKKHKLKKLMFLDGDLLVWSGANYDCVCFWNSDPKNSDSDYLYSDSEFSGTVLDMLDGGTLVENKVIHKGDKDIFDISADNHTVADGTHWWLKSYRWNSETRQTDASLHEVDPITRKTGRASMPSFFENFVRDDATLVLKQSSLLPLGAFFAKSLLGVQGNLIGGRVRKSTNGTVEIEGIDGRTLKTSGAANVTYLLSQAATKGFLPVATENDEDECKYTLLDPTASYEISVVEQGSGPYGRGQVSGLPANYLHAFQIRDEAASKKLRSITDAQIQALLKAEQKDFEKRESTKEAPAKSKNGIDMTKFQTSGQVDQAGLEEESNHYPGLDAAIRKLLGAKVPPRLLAGLRGIVVHAGQKMRQLEKLVEKRSSEASGKISNQDMIAVDAACEPFFRSLDCPYSEVAGFSFMDSVTALAKFFTGETSSVQFPMHWMPLMQILTDGVPRMLWSRYCLDPADKTWVPFAEAWCDQPYGQVAGWLRRFSGYSDDEDFLRDLLAAQGFDQGRSSDDFDDDINQLCAPYIGNKSRYLISDDYGTLEIIEYSPDGDFESIPGLSEQKDSHRIIPPGAWSAEALKTFIELASTQPINFPGVDLLKSVADDAKTSVAEVALVWFGLPNFDQWSNNFMPTHLREACKLKTKETANAKDALKAMDENVLSSLVRSITSGDPKGLWENPPIQVADRLRAAWSAIAVRRIQLDPEVVAKLATAIRYKVEIERMLQALNSPLTDNLFSDQGIWKFSGEAGCNTLDCHDEQFEFNGDALVAATVSIALLNYHLPAGDASRQQIHEVFQATKKALGNPNLLLSGATRSEYSSKKISALAGLAESIVGKLQKYQSIQLADDGIAVAACDEEELEIAFRPAALKTKAQFERLANQLRSLNSDNKNGGEEISDALQHLQIFRSEEFAALVERAKTTPVPPDGFESNPLHSAPDVVKQVAKKQGLSENAAAYYLQLLTLPDPTDKNVALWNGWTPATQKNLAKELLEKKLVLEATRARAGRKYFLAGGWEDLKSPHLPLETWKMPLYQMTRDGSQRASAPLGVILPLTPVHELFAKAWQRIVDGDVPKYEGVK